MRSLPLNKLLTKLRLLHMVILFLGDIFGSAGRKAVKLALNDLKERFKPDFILANIENLAGGRGVTIDSYYEIKATGIDGFTSGNHIWDNKEVINLFEKEEPIFRPANYPDFSENKCPGKGFGVLSSKDKSIFIVNLLGRLFMDNIDCPFVVIEKCLKENKKNYPVIIDMHAEATSEKYAIGWFLDGKASAVIGTHTHVQTADERMLPNGTAYISDIGMCGSFDSVIGLKIEPVIKKFITSRRSNYGVAKNNLIVCGVSVCIGLDNKATSIERFKIHVHEEQ